MIWTALLVFLAGCAALNTVAGALEKVVKAVKAARAPGGTMDDRITVLEEWKKDVERKLSNDMLQLEEIHKGLRSTFQALLALLDHGLDGNNITQMEAAKTALEQHLIDRH